MSLLQNLENECTGKEEWRKVIEEVRYHPGMLC